jgi:hypothetical protein
VGVQRRDIGIAVVLSIVTCGIYGIYWYYKLIDDCYKINGLASNAGMDLLLSFVTCGFYTIYMNYKMGVLSRDASGGRNDDKPVLYLILCIFGLSIINFCILQSDLNNYFADGSSMQ